MYGLAVIWPDGVRDVTVDYVPMVAQPRVRSMPSDGAWLTGRVMWPVGDERQARDDGRQVQRVLFLAAFLLGAAMVSTLAIVLAALVR